MGVHERLVAAFGAATIAAGGDRDAETDALGRVAVQLACLSAEQTRLLDAAFAEATTRVVARITAAGT